MLLPLPLAGSVAQAQGVCFMVDGSGNTIDLGNLCGQTEQRQPQVNANGAVRVPIKRRDGGIPVIEVTFNGDHTYEMLLDTGASVTLITQEMARDLRLAQGSGLRFTTFQMGDGSIVPMQIAQIRSVSVDRAVVNNVSVAIADGMSIGLLGQSFFQNYDLHISQNAIEFHRR
jgi:aspartyl protease family protein